MHTDFSYTNGSFSGNDLENDLSSSPPPPTSSSSSSSPSSSPPPSSPSSSPSTSSSPSSSISPATSSSPTTASSPTTSSSSPSSSSSSPSFSPPPSSSPLPSASLSCSPSSSSTPNAQQNDDETSITLVRNHDQGPSTITVIKVEANDSDNDNWTTLAVDIYEDIFENLLLGIIFDFYKHTQLRTIKVEELSSTNEISENKIYENPKLDIYGHSLSKIRKLECCCPNCSRSLAAFRLAPHLEKCLGMGRNSSRIASKRIAQVIKTTNGID